MKEDVEDMFVRKSWKLPFDSIDRSNVYREISYI